MAISLRITDGPPLMPWLSPDIEAGQASSGMFTLTPQLTTGQRYDFRLRVYNDGTASADHAVPWIESSATGSFVVPLTGAGGLCWPLSVRTVASAPGGAARAQLVAAGSNYSLELQNGSGSMTFTTMESLLDPGNADRRVGIVFSPDGAFVVLLDYHLVSKTVDVRVFTAKPLGALPAGREIVVSGALSVFLINLSFIGIWNNSAYAGLNFSFVPGGRGLWLNWLDSTNFLSYAVVELGERAFHPNRVSIAPRSSGRMFGQIRFSPAGDLLALIPPQTNQSLELYELPSGRVFDVSYNGYGSGTLMLTNLNANISVVDGTAYGGITVSGISTGLATSANTIDPPFRARCAVQVHLWITTPAGSINENDPSNLKLPSNVSKQGASAYIARINRGQSQEVIVVSQYLAPAMTSATDHRCAFAEAYSVAGAQPFQAKQRSGSAFNVLAFAQVAQRNLTILAPNSPFFIAPYAIANFGDKPVDVEVTVDAVNPASLANVASLALLKKKSGKLDVTSVGFIDYPCGRLTSRKEVKPLPKLSLSLKPGQRHVYALLIDVAKEPDPKRFDVAAFNIVERRSDGMFGGATVLATSNPDWIGETPVVEPPGACPVALLHAPYWCDEATAPPRRPQPSAPGASAGFLAAEIVNQSNDVINELELWIESHALADSRIEPLVFRARQLDPGEAMFVAWPALIGTDLPGQYPISIVAQSPKHGPRRLLTVLAIRGATRLDW